MMVSFLLMLSTHISKSGSSSVIRTVHAQVGVPVVMQDSTHPPHSLYQEPRDEAEGAIVVFLLNWLPKAEAMRESAAVFANDHAYQRIRKVELDLQWHERRIFDCAIALKEFRTQLHGDGSFGLYRAQVLAESRRKRDSLQRELAEFEQNKQLADMANALFQDMRCLEAVGWYPASCVRWAKKNPSIGFAQVLSDATSYGREYITFPANFRKRVSWTGVVQEGFVATCDECITLSQNTRVDVFCLNDTTQWAYGCSDGKCGWFPVGHCLITFFGVWP